MRPGMKPGVRGVVPLDVKLLFALFLCGSWTCATQPAAIPPARPSVSHRVAAADDDPGASPRPADAETDVAYYRVRAAALTAETPAEIGPTDFGRFRRGRLYLTDAGDPQGAKTLQGRLTTAFDGNDSRAILEITAKILADDQADIRAHMLRAIALRKVGRSREADFHRAVALGLIDSIVRTGDGRAAKSAWTVFRVKEEYEVIKVMGCTVESQSLISEGGRRFDILEARKAPAGPTIRAYFDITELFAEEGREVEGRQAK